MTLREFLMDIKKDYLTVSVVDKDNTYQFETDKIPSILKSQAIDFADLDKFVDHSEDRYSMIIVYLK